MRSIFTKILAWAVGTTALALVGLAVTSRLVESRRPGRIDFLAKTQALQLEGAQRALAEGGHDGLARYLRRLNELFGDSHYLVDAQGRDLLDGRDLSEPLGQASWLPGPPVNRQGRILIASPPRGSGPRLLIVIRPTSGPPSQLPYTLWILVVIVGLAYALAVHLARPLRALQVAVERFGHGDLATRIHTTRGDEIGELSRAFDEMAGRIETLLAAERRLLQDVSHELRSPLARLSFAVELARTGDDRDRALDRIKRDIGRLTQLVGELIELARAEGDPASRDLREFRLGDLLRDVVDDCRVEAEAKGCQVDLRDHDGGASTVRGEPELLRRAFENVVRNAIRHAPVGTVVEVDLRPTPSAATVSVRDRGEGVPEAALGSIFEPFFRVESDRSRSSGGVGLGLAITRRAVAVHGGSIEAHNAHPGLDLVIGLPRALNARNGTQPSPPLDPP